jgi:hypothetical protein
VSQTPFLDPRWDERVRRDVAAAPVVTVTAPAGRDIAQGAPAPDGVIDLLHEWGWPAVIGNADAFATRPTQTSVWAKLDATGMIWGTSPILVEAS